MSEENRSTPDPNPEDKEAGVAQAGSPPTDAKGEALDQLSDDDTHPSRRRKSAEKKRRRRRTNSVVIVAGVVAVAAVAGALLIRPTRSDSTSPTGGAALPPSPQAAESAVGSDDLADGGSAVADDAAPLQSVGKFEFHRKIALDKDSFMMIGLLTNTSKTPVAEPELQLSLLGTAEGRKKILRTASAPALKKHLAPGESTPVQVAVFEPPKHESAKFVVKAKPIETMPDYATELRIDDEPPEVDDGQYRFSGKVHNEGSERVDSVVVQILALDDSDKMLGFASVTLEGPLEAGGTAEYESQPLHLVAPPANIRASAWGQTGETAAAAGSSARPAASALPPTSALPPASAKPQAPANKKPLKKPNKPLPKPPADQTPESPPTP